MTNITDGLCELAGDGLIAVRTGPALAQLLDELPAMADSWQRGLHAFATWLADTLHDQSLAGKVAEAAGNAKSVHAAAEQAQAVFSVSAQFWLTEGTPAGLSRADDIAEALAPGFIPENGSELEDTMEGLAEFARLIEESVTSIGAWYDGERGQNDQPAADLIAEMGKMLGNARDYLDEADTEFGNTYLFWTRGY